MSPDGNSAAWGAQNDPFAEDCFVWSPEEEIRARAEQMRKDNRDALRHFVELLVWEVHGNKDLLEVVVSLLWNWEAIEPRWIAEASFMSVGDASRLAESRPLMVFHCLDCAVERRTASRRQRTRMHESLEAFCRGEADEHHLRTLLCESCVKQRDEHYEEQRLLDVLRQQALLDDYRRQPYAERRQTKEWAVIKNRIHRRDKYRCRLCGRDDLELHVHHCTYANYGQERLEDLISLCGPCHHRFHFNSEAS
jgi:5-methylcytosine-specific restriction endonuclease McrA